jgi:DNA-binding beta-propeller fold protein YncE
MWGPREVTIGPAGLVYVADTGNKRISVFTPDGIGVRQIGNGGSFEGELEEPVGIVVGDDELIYVADTWNARIQVFTNEGVYLREWAVPEWEGQSLNNKPYLALDNAGRIYASAPEGYRILAWDLYGKPVSGWGNYGNDLQSFNLPTGIDFDVLGGLYVADTENDRVLYFEQVKE